MNKKEKEILNSNSKRPIKVALFVITGIVVFYLGANFLKGIDTFNRKTYYYTVLEKSAGLNVGNVVVINGYSVGKISAISMMSARPFRICVELFIKEDVQIPTDSRIEVIGNPLTSPVLSLILGNAHTYANPKDTLLALDTQASLMDDLGSILLKLNATLTSFDTIALSLKDVLVHENGSQNIAMSLNHLENVMAEANLIVGVNKVKINRIVTDLAEFSKALNTSSPQLKTIIGNFDRISDSLAKANIAEVIENANKAMGNLNSIIYKINTGEGDIGQLLNNDTLYRNLEMATHNLNSLVKDIKENPGRYVTIKVFGGKSKEERQAAKEAKKVRK